MTMITPSYLGETIEYSSLHACRSTLEDPTRSCWSSSTTRTRVPVGFELMYSIIRSSGNKQRKKTAPVCTF